MSEVARGNDDRPCPRLSQLAVTRARLDGERVVTPADAFDVLVLPNVQVEQGGHRAIVRERIAPRGLLGGHDERYPADREALGRREKRDVRGIARDPAHDARAVDDHRPESRALERDRRREPAGPRADDHRIEPLCHVHDHSTPMIWSRRVPTLTYAIGVSASSRMRSR